MKEEDEIFKEWYEINFEELPSPLDYMYLRDSLDFQRYLLWYRYKELGEELLNTFERLISKIKRKVRCKNGHMES